MLEAGKNLKLVARAGSGVDNIDHIEATKRCCAALCRLPCLCQIMRVCDSVRLCTCAYVCVGLRVCVRVRVFLCGCE